MPPVPALELPISRTKNAAATREAILTAARRRFLQESYDSVGLRDIAGDAGVDVALVSRYFGGKEKLFLEVVGKEKADWLPPSSAAELPALLTAMFMDHDEEEHRQHAEKLLIILRSASSPTAAAIVHESLHNVLNPMTERLDGQAPETRASLAMAVWMGVTMMRSIMAVAPMCDKDCDVLSTKLRALFQTALSTDDRPERACGSA